MLRVVYGRRTRISNFMPLFIHILELAVLSDMHHRNCFPFAGPAEATVYEQSAVARRL